MFAVRAGLSGNVSYNGILGRRKRKKKKQAFRCWVPFVWQAFVAVIAGLVVMAAGIALCVVGYYAGGAMSAVDLFRDYKSDQVDMTNNDTWSRNVTISYLHNLTYVGPMLMGCGCFSAVIACVVVCEKRDKQLKAFALREARNPRPPKMDVCERIVRYVIAKCKDRKQRRQQNSGTSAVTCRLINADPDVEQQCGQVTRDTCIAVALKTIPTSLFAVDCDRRRLTSIAPVNVGGDMPCRKIVSVMSLPCIFVENTYSCSVNTKASERSAAHMYEHLDRFQSKHSRQPCMYHDELLWSFDIATGQRKHATREESNKIATPLGENSVTSNFHATSACYDSGGSNEESGCRKQLEIRESLKHSSIPRIAITSIDDRQVAPVDKTATVIVHQAAMSVDDDDVTKDKARRGVSESDQRSRYQTAVVGQLANGTRDVPANHCYVTSTLDRGGAVPISQGLVRSTSSASDGEKRQSSLHNHAYVV